MKTTFATRWRRTTERLDLSGRAIAMLAIAVSIVGTAGVVLAVTVEDVTAHNGLASSDASHLRWFTGHRSSALTATAKLLTDLGSVVVLGVLGLVLAAVLWHRGIKLVLAAGPAFALGVAGAIAGIAKLAVGRRRPPVAQHLVTESGASFPSGHATDSTALLVSVGLVLAIAVITSPWVRAAIVAGCGLLAAAIGWSRLELGVHWPTDVVAGWLLGLLTAVTVTVAATLAARLTPDRQPPSPAARARLRDRIVRVLTAQRPTTHRLA